MHTACSWWAYGPPTGLPGAENPPPATSGADAPPMAGTDGPPMGAWGLRTARLWLRPVHSNDLPHIHALKADPRAFAGMLGGVRDLVRAQRELAEDIAFWGRYGCGMWSVWSEARFEGIAGFHDRPDGRGVGLRFAFRPESRGRGLAREAAGAALRHAHDQAGIARVVAVAREHNLASRTVLGAIGMRECDRFARQGFAMVVYESRREAQPQHAAPPAPC